MFRNNNGRIAFREQVLQRILVVIIVVSLSTGGGVGNCHTATV